MLFALDRRVKFQVRQIAPADARQGVGHALPGRAIGRPEAPTSADRRGGWLLGVVGQPRHRRFREFGPASLHDARADNGAVKIDEPYLSMLYNLVNQSPQDHGYPRPTWTQELLAKVMAQQAGVKVHRSTMSRALAMIGARLGRPRPTVGCPWSKSHKTRRLKRDWAPAGRSAGG